jgi:hypothetical protein
MCKVIIVVRLRMVYYSKTRTILRWYLQCIKKLVTTCTAVYVYIYSELAQTIIVFKLCVLGFVVIKSFPYFLGKVQFDTLNTYRVCAKAQPTT